MKLYILISDAGDGSYHVDFTLNPKLIEELQEAYDDERMDYDNGIGVDSDGFGYTMVEVPDDSTAESLGVTLLDDHFADKFKKAEGIFVFGSNLAGIHGAGAAADAMEKHGAVWGQGIGRQGNSYGIPTKDGNIKTLPLPAIYCFVQEFIQYARENPNEKFYVTRIGCGLAGYTDAQIAPMFRDAPPNCKLPEGWGQP